MQISNLPKLLPIPFAQTGARQNIPNDSQIGIEGGRASYTDGFPPLTRTPIAAGGIPPFGTDFNGIFHDTTDAIRWNQAGGGYRYDSAFSTSVGGYPVGAILSNTTGDGCWLNTVDGNTNSPESALATPLTGWVPVNAYGDVTITGLGSSSITLSTLQAAKDKIILSGTLTTNINLTFPAWKKNWVVVNNCSGNFTVTCKTTAGTGTAVSSGVTARITCDGINISLNSVTSPSSVQGVSGYLIIPALVGGVEKNTIIQWGAWTNDATGDSTVVFPFPFPNNALQLFVSSQAIGTGAYAGWNTLTKTGFKGNMWASVNTRQSGNSTYLAIGD